MPLPALLTIQSGATKLRYATLMGIKKAKTKEVRRISAAELADAGRPSIRLERIYTAGEDETVADLRRPAERSGGETGREAAVRSAGDL